MERKVHPGCANASNPFHQCGDHCAAGGRSQNPRMKIVGGKIPVRNGDGFRAEATDVDPNCVNASNPFHRCGDSCNGQRSVAAKKQSDKGKAVINGERVREEERYVDPNCANASNHFHQCTEHCNKKTAHATKQFTTGRTAQNGTLSDKVRNNPEERRKVDPSCANASNPFHQCTEYCSQRTAGAKR